MGVEYTIACRSCKVKRDLHKMDIRSIKDKDDAITYSDELESKTNLYREGLALSFLNAHCHCDSIIYFSEFDDEKVEECWDYKEENFWD